jgi:hypothetical protein
LRPDTVPRDNVAQVEGRSVDKNLLLGIVTIPSLFILGLLARLWRNWSRHRRDRQLLLAIDDAVKAIPWHHDLGELEYRNRIRDHVVQRVDVMHEAEHPLPSHTKIDLWLQNRGDQWFVTFKKAGKRQGLDNQQRLVLQGEIEDIVTHAKHERVRRVRIVLVVGVTDFHSSNDEAVLRRLLNHIDERHGALEQDTKTEGTFEFNLVPVPLVGAV